MSERQSYIVAVDGPSGVGKSTVIGLVATQLLARGHQCEVVANNSAGPFSEIIGALAQSPTQTFALALTTAAARAYLHTSANADITVCDRHILSTFVYQGRTGIPLEYLYVVNAPLLDKVLFVLLELPTDELTTRRQARARENDDWFKRFLDINDEIRRYNESAVYLAERGHEVVRVPADEPAKGVAARIVRATELFISGVRA